MPQKTVTDVMQDVFEGSKFKCLPYEKRNLDEDPYSEYGEYDYRIRGRMFENPETNTISPHISNYLKTSGRRISESCCVAITFERFEERPDADRV